MRMFTLQMGKRFQAERHGIKLVDTTVKSSIDKLFAPKWSMVLGHKSGEISDEEYSKEYRRMMIESWTLNRPRWEEYLRNEEWQGFACYCKPGEFCHRLLLKDIFQELCTKLNIPFEYYGEFK